MHPAQRGELDLGEGLPRLVTGGSTDQLGLAVAVDRLGQGVVERVPDATDRGDRADLGEPLAVAHRHEPRPGIAVTPQPVQPGAARPAGHLHGVEHHDGAHVRRDAPPDDHAGERVEDEAHQAIPAQVGT